MINKVLFFSFLVCYGATIEAAPMVGGHSEYTRYKGTAEIISVTKIASAEEEARDEYEIKFIFHPQEDIDGQSLFRASQTVQLFAEGGTNPTKWFMDQHNITVGKQIRCFLKIITRGTCTPVIFEFPWMTPGER